MPVTSARALIRASSFAVAYKVVGQDALTVSVKAYSHHFDSNVAVDCGWRVERQLMFLAYLAVVLNDEFDFVDCGGDVID